MSEEPTALARRRQLRNQQLKQNKIEDIISLMDNEGITVQDIQNRLESMKDEPTTYDRVLNRRQARRANQRRRKALKLAQQKKQEKAKANNVNKKKTSRKTKSQENNGQDSEQTNG